jgi:hypothetical protein
MVVDGTESLAVSLTPASSVKGSCTHMEATRAWNREDGVEDSPA